MNIASAIKAKTERYADYLIKEEPYFKRLQAGTLEAISYAKFLVCIRYLVQHTPIHLKLAIDQSKNIPALQAFFKSKFVEEQGHDQWATDDLNKIKHLLPEGKSFDTPTAEIKTYVRMIESLIKEDPHFYPSYIFYTEYLTVLVGAVMDDGLTNKCGFGKKVATIVTDHAELDKHHISEGEKAISDLVDSDKYYARSMEIIDDIIEAHKRMFLSCL